MTTAPPLQGRKVLDFTQNLPGPYASFLLASLGAEVIKVEPPRGDPARHAEPLFSLLNRGKRSVALDLREPGSRPALEALVRWADVLLEGFRPGVMDRLGCGFAEARALNPRLIYCSISAFGQEGPRAQEPGHDLNLQALTGLCHLERDRQERPRPTVLPVADLSSSLVAVSAICAALASPDGGERHLDVAMCDALLSWVQTWSVGVDTAAELERSLKRAGPARPVLARLLRPLLASLDRAKLYSMPNYGLYRTGDGRALSLGIVDERHFWEALCRALGLAPLARLSVPARTVLAPLVRALIGARLRRGGLGGWLERLTEAGVPATAVLDSAEAARERQFAARGLFDERGRPASPLPGGTSPLREAPALGEHTREVLAALGLSPDQA